MFGYAVLLHNRTTMKISERGGLRENIKGLSRFSQPPFSKSAHIGFDGVRWASGEFGKLVVA